MTDSSPAPVLAAVPDAAAAAQPAARADATLAHAVRPIRFWHRGARVEISASAPTRSVLDWLREDAHCTGTKEGCNEGDCGACTVVIGAAAELGEAGAVRGLRLTTVNACIQFLPTLDGKALFTVEDLKAIQAGSAVKKAAGKTAGKTAEATGTATRVKPDPLHPVQRALVDCHGSQCGFCTPGFVMSLWSAYEHHEANTQGDARVARPTRQQLADALSGNLCRCTGYRPILDAGERMFDLARVTLDTAPVLQELAALAALAKAGDATGASFHAASHGPRFFAPTTLAALAALREALPQAQLLAGSTDVGVWVNKQFRALGDIVYLGAVAELKAIHASDTTLTIGAGAALEEAFAALAARWPSLTEVWLRFASPPIRHAGTIGGNVANGSPIGDCAPVLMALDAQLELRRGTRVRRLALADFYTGYLTNRLEPGEFVQALLVPLDVPLDLPLDPPQVTAPRRVRVYKISKRFDCDISALCAGCAIGLDGAGAGVISSIRLAFGGLAATVQRATRTEAALLGQPWSQASVRAAQTALAQDFKPLSDLRASAAYRLQVAQNLLQRFWLETRVDNPLPPEATRVFSGMAQDRPLAGSAR